MCAFPCKCNCCERTFCPIELACARTIHSFQGLQAGPVDEGKTPNVWDSLVCDVDENFWEGKNLGLLCTAVSRGTTLGTLDALGSAIHFSEKSLTRDRILNLTHPEDSNEEFPMSVNRRRWVDHIARRATLSRPLIDAIMSNADSIVRWCEATHIDRQALCARIDQCKMAMTTRKRKLD